MKPTRRVTRVLKAWGLRLVRFVARWRWISVSLALGCVGFVGYWIDLPKQLGFVLSIASFVILGVDVVRQNGEFRRMTFTKPANEKFADVERKLAEDRRIGRLAREDATIDLAAIGLAADFDQVFLTQPNGRMVLDLALGDRIAAGAAHAVLDDRYRLPEMFAEPGRRFQQEFVGRDPFAYNDPVLGLRAVEEQGGRTATFHTSPSEYWDYIASDLFASRQVEIDGRAETRLGRPLFVRANNRLRSYTSSWLLNSLGCQIIAVTNDGKLILTKQTIFNDEADLQPIAPSGSGSCEPKDFAGASRMRLDRLLLNGAMRELEEETGIAASHTLDSVHFLGFGRWLEKGGKPEGFGLVVLKNISSHEVPSKPPRGDRRYSRLLSPSPLARDMDSWDGDDLTSIIPAYDVSGLSVPLGASLWLLARAVQQKSSSIRAALVGPLDPNRSED